MGRRGRGRVSMWLKNSFLVFMTSGPYDKSDSETRIKIILGEENPLKIIIKYSHIQGAT